MYPSRAARVSRRDLLRGLAAVGLVAAGLPIAGCGSLRTPTWEAPQSGPLARVWRVGILAQADHQLPIQALDTFVQALREAGYRVDQNLALEIRSAEGRVERLRELAGDLVRRRVDVIVTAGAPAIRAAMQATDTLPILALAGDDPVDHGFVAGLARRGENVTGVSTFAPPLSARRLALLGGVVPGATRFAVLWNAANPAVAPAFRQAQAAAQRTRAHLQSLAVRRPEDLEEAFDAATHDGADALLVLGDDLVFAERARIADLAASHRLPAMYTAREYVTAGGLMAYGVELADVYRRAAAYADQLMHGVKPAELPVEPPTRFALSFNLKAAQALDVAIPPALLREADDVIH